MPARARTAGRTGGVKELDVDYRPGEIYLSRIELHPGRQGRGIGTSLIRALIDEAMQKGQDLVLDVLTVRADWLASGAAADIHITGFEACRYLFGLTTG